VALLADLGNLLAMLRVGLGHNGRDRLRAGRYAGRRRRGGCRRAFLGAGGQIGRLLQMPRADK